MVVLGCLIDWDGLSNFMCLSALSLLFFDELLVSGFVCWETSLNFTQMEDLRSYVGDLLVVLGTLIFPFSCNLLFIDKVEFT